MRTTTSNRRLAPIALAVLLAACGGGGGGGGGDSNTGTGPPPTSVSLTGTAAKGLMANADVSVYAVKADGTADTSAALARTTTDVNGKYSLGFTGSQGQPYVVMVSAKADGSTTAADEASGKPVTLPPGFAMRALLVPATSGSITTSANITPFSELAAAAAGSASGGITAANAAQALSTVKQLIGFDPTTTNVATTKTAGTADEQRLAVLLSAVSQMANNSGTLGCAGADLSARTKCVVQTLAGAASTSTLKLTGAAGADVSAALASAINQVLTSDLAGNVNAATLNTVVANLGCTTNCSVAGTTPSSDPLAAAIAAAKLLFSQLKADWSTMFSGDGVTSVSKGAANAQAFKFQQAMSDMQQPIDTIVLDEKSLFMGINLYNNYKAGRTAATSHAEGAGEVPNNNRAAYAGLARNACQLYQDAATSVNATTPANANYIGCSTYYYAQWSAIAGGQRNAFYRHAFFLAPNPDGSFTWQARARRTINECKPSCVRIANDNLQADPVTGADVYFSGTITQALTGKDITAVAMQGELPAGFASAGTTLVNYKYAVTTKAARTIDAASGDVVSGTISAGSGVSKDQAGSTLATLTIKTGQLLTTPVSRDSKGNIVAPGSPRAVAAAGYQAIGLSLDLLYATAGASVEGVFSVSDPAWDKSQTKLIPTKFSFSGTLATTDGGVTTNFLTGTLTSTVAGYGSFDATQPLSATNYHTVPATFVGTVTAPGRPVIELTFSGSTQTDAHTSYMQPATLQYRTLVNGKARTVVNFTASPTTPGSSDHMRFTFSEAASGLSGAWQGGVDTKVKLMKDTLEVGTLDMNTQMITFKDGSVMSLDIGL